MQTVAVQPIAAIPVTWSLPSRRRVGVACLIATESSLFSIFLIAYLFYMGKGSSGPTPRDVLEVPVLATVCLLSSSVTIVLAERALARGRERTFRLWWGATILLAVEFLGSTALEWYRLIVERGFTIGTNVFGSTYYSLVGLHASHVIAGLGLLALVFYFSLRGVPLRPHGERVEMLSWYWHFVDAVWVVVFITVYVLGR